MNNYLPKPKTYIFEVINHEAGQRRRYGDSYYSYTIKNNSEIDYSEHVIKSFCTGFLKPAISAEKRNELKKDSFDAHFQTYFTEFKKINEREYSYKVVMPSTH
ncbi:hypothetical protein [Changchengzhania lutea]|uniref:hypothetical protein n=1 Tax=Changchengzhania lutea TaxID=2049305 RepID=UPI00115CD1F9|nr:hypothetical protein [Changchengzhania lutea]